MKSLYTVSLFACLMLAALLVLPFAYAQRGPGAGPRGLMYNPATETTIKGAVEEVKSVSGRRGWHGTHLMLKTGDKTIDVHLGPESFLKGKGFSLAKGDQVEVVGSTVNLRGGEAVIAREVRKGGETLVLRDEKGIPQWSRSRRR
jgi:hypothetical protein